MWKCKSRPNRDYPESFRVAVFYNRVIANKKKLLKIPSFIQEEFLPDHPDHDGSPRYGLIEPGVLYLSNGEEVEHTVSLLEFCSRSGHEIGTDDLAGVQLAIRSEIMEQDEVCHVLLADGNEIKELNDDLLKAISEQAAAMDLLIVEFEESDVEDFD